MRPQTRLRKGEEYQEEHDHGNGRDERAAEILTRQPVPLRRVPLAVRIDESEEHCAGKGQREAPQPAEERSGVHVDDKQGDSDSVERHRPDEEDSTDCGERASDGPSEHRRPVGPHTVESREVPIVHRCAHSDAGTRAVEEKPQTDGDHNGDQHLGQLVVRHHNITDLEILALEKV